MSSLRNYVPRRAHKDRFQPQARKKFVILEKPKYYRQRAKAYNAKENIIQILKENPDEFYFNMIRTKTVNGVHIPELARKRMQVRTISFMYMYILIELGT
ncbi:probable U3 small nucleolar RNA-associated protein 11 [Papaver somniferum]|uniref:probable U3 small nucleolar RNA-associated protein 11 n=1 Tax=Papaver somniferum TaxID=3469 RepID=UPI000E6F9DB9|nr:probable U3 small nucleolar RNA-associated protein 11 [Papaver somniferum]